MTSNEEISNQIKTYLYEHKKISFALLFGSFINEKNNAMSDIDIALYFNGEVNLIELGQIISALEKIAKRKVDVVELNELYKKNPLLAFNIISNSEPLFFKDETEFINFKTRTHLEYFDTERLRTSVRKTFRNRISEKKFGKRNYA